MSTPGVFCQTDYSTNNRNSTPWSHAVGLRRSKQTHARILLMSDESTLGRGE